jgi:hypothetical protein
MAFAKQDEPLYPAPPPRLAFCRRICHILGLVAVESRTVPFVFTTLLWCGTFRRGQGDSFRGMIFSFVFITALMAYATKRATWAA